MRNLFLASIAAALALSAAPARADGEYPVQEKLFATGIDLEDIVTPDVTYPGPHGVVMKDFPGPGPGAVATSEDFQYRVDDPLPVKTVPHCHPARDTQLAKADCECTHC